MKRILLGALTATAVVFAALLSGGALKVPSQGLRLTDWYALATAHNGMNNYSTQTIVALGTNQATAAQITAPMVFINTSSASTGVVLPPCFGTSSGSIVFINNQSGQTITVYGKGSDTINTTAGATGVTQANNNMTDYLCAVNAKWGK